MAIVFMDGFSHYSTSELDKKWTKVDAAGSTWTIAAEGRTDGCAKRVGGDGFIELAPFMVQAGGWTPTASGVCGFAFKVDDLSEIAGGAPGVYNSIYESSNNIFSVKSGLHTHFDVVLQQNGTLVVFNYSNNTILGTSIEAVNAGVWSYLEFKWIIGESGTLIIKRDGTTILSLSGVDMAWDKLAFPSPPDNWTSVKIAGCATTPAATSTIRVCDLYLIDLTGTFNNDFLGDVTVEYIKPDGTGADADWTPNSAVANWTVQDDVPPDSDTSYVSTTTVSDRDSYSFEDVVGDPLAIQIVTFARAESTGAAAIEHSTRIGGVDYEFNDFGIPDTAYAFQVQPLDTSPDSGVQWTKTEIDASEFGIVKAG